mgnify:CR=1 FL=1
MTRPRSAAATAYHCIDSAAAVSEYGHKLRAFKWEAVDTDGVVMARGPTAASLEYWLDTGCIVRRQVKT